ncbi:hypothetical protein A4A49_37805 [Nicotiana attenuata]|uniref:Uncharacterized protein n=1 Tax=Nicotiana attenuata TaxID=49451 RepID=A0A1J6HWF7_NICAT|nr:hypothetical protein A4A49_37805 [Nicotiana attenuata]
MMILSFLSELINQSGHFEITRPVSWRGMLPVGFCSHGVVGLSFLPEVKHESEPKFLVTLSVSYYLL